MLNLLKEEAQSGSIVYTQFLNFEEVDELYVGE